MYQIHCGDVTRHKLPARWEYNVRHRRLILEGPGGRGNRRLEYDAGWSGGILGSHSGGDKGERWRNEVVDVKGRSICGACKRGTPGT